jgi:hypothetical protein
MVTDSLLVNLPHFPPVKIPTDRRESQIEMSERKRDPSHWRVKRTFEPNRLSLSHLEAAYAQIVPIHLRILHSKTSAVRASEQSVSKERQERRTG